MQDSREDKALNAQRQMLYAVSLLGAISSSVGVTLLPITPGVTLADYLLQWSFVIVLGGASLAMTIYQEVNLARLCRIVVSAISVGFAARFGAGIFAAGQTEMGGSDTMLPYAGWWPMPLVMVYLFLPRNQAVRAGVTYCLALALMLGAYSSLYWSAFLADFGMLCLAVQVIFAHPLFLALLHIASALQAERATPAHADTPRATPPTTDDTDTPLPFRVFFERLREAAQGQSDKTLVVASYEKSQQIDGPDCPLRATQSALQDAEIGIAAATRMGDCTLVLLCRENPLNMADNAFISRLRTQLPPGLELRLGITRHIPPESPQAWLERGQFAAYNAEGAGEIRIGTDG